MSTLRRSFLAIWLCCGCGAAAGPAHGPRYDPVASAEAQSPCASQWQAAKEAREALIGQNLAARARSRAAAVVFAQAECERRYFDEQRIASPSYDGLMEAIKPVRAQYLNALNLYLEVADYRMPRLAVAGYARAGDLHTAFAEKLRATVPPTEMRAPAERADFLGEMDEAAEVIDAQAIKSWQLAADTASVVPELLAHDDVEVKSWLAATCRGLARFRKAHPFCVAQARYLR